MRQMKAWNKASLAKRIWNICTHADDIWTRWVRVVLLKQKSIWQVDVPNDCCYSWRKILKLRNIIKSLIHVKIGDGRQTSLFYDCWVGNKAIIDNIHLNGEVNVWGEDTLVADWIRDGIWHIPDSFRRKFPGIARDIQQIPIANQPDTVVWRICATGLFSTSSCYNAIRIKFAKVWWHNVVWTKQIFPRHGFILWLIMRGRLKTKAYLARLHIGADDRCSFCQSKSEEIDHLFFECDYTKSVWSKVLSHYSIIRNPQCWRTEIQWFKRRTRGRSKTQKMLKTLLAATLYFLWMERNRRVHDKNAVSSDSIVSQIMNFMILKFSY